MANSTKIRKVQGVFKHYDWGGKTFLPSLIHRDNSEGKPYAEYWLGSDVHEGIDKLPYLFKVQDVEKMLSIQVHPTKAVAQKKFEEENEKGIPRDAPHRNYKDDNHKPELLSPLGDFYLLHGFKPVARLKKILQDTPELNFLVTAFGTGDYKSLYTHVMTMEQQALNDTLSPLLSRIVPLYQQGKLKKDQEDFWAARASLTFQAAAGIDRGIFSIYLFNIVKMTEGQALFQDAGLPHAYLEGHTMEIMANSDNVLRGGLTPKHIDVPELLAHVVFAPTHPRIIKAAPIPNREQVYQTPAEDFQLSRILVQAGMGLSLTSPCTDIYFCYAGSGTATADEEGVYIEAGEALLAMPGTAVHFAAAQSLTLYRATTPTTR